MSSLSLSLRAMSMLHHLRRPGVAAKGPLLHIHTVRNNNNNLLAQSVSRPSFQSQPMAFYWMDVVRVKVDKNGKRRHEDPEMVVRRHQEERRSDGQSLLDLEAWNDRHEKNWMRRKRLEQKRRYDFDKKHVSDLAKYIAFVQENSEK
ncbi:hypothetical protein IV203_009899 [Nitzschia inconspicua]|uniref:Uncharacterized protein n=1 Tax=Nitzschia inconspicua TaxID=303405 RepID=A0A9K3KV44_9STRA|nr:hypothetical protein IV203_009899 [Nitzschia inconspicua]